MNIIISSHKVDNGKEPFISVVMSCHNSKKRLKTSIESILDQTYKNFEFIIIDDGSTDDTLDIIRGYSASDRRIKIIEKPNTGLADSLNEGIKIAKGGWIARMDADDVSFVDRFEKQIEFIKKNPEIDVLGTGAVLISPNNEIQNSILLSERHEQITKDIFKRTIIFHSSVIMKKAFFEKVGGYDTNLLRSQDFDLWLKGIKLGHKYHNLQCVLLKYYTNNYKRMLKDVKDKFISALIITFRYRYFRKGLSWALMELFRGVFINLGWYGSRSLKKVGR